MESSRADAYSLPRSALDWPLSTEEKHTWMLRLYEKDVRAANILLDAKEASVEKLAHQVCCLRRKSVPSVVSAGVYAGRLLCEVDDDPAEDLAEDVLHRVQERDVVSMHTSLITDVTTEAIMAAPSASCMAAGSTRGEACLRSNADVSFQAAEVEAVCNPQTLLSLVCSMWQQQSLCVPQVPCVDRLPVPCVGPCARRPLSSEKVH